MIARLFQRLLLGGATSAIGAPIWLWVIGALVLALGASEVTRRLQTASLQVEATTAKADLSKAREEAATAAREASEKYRKIEEAMALKDKENRDAINEEKRLTRAAFDRGRAADRGLRDSIANASGGCAAARDPAAAARADERASAIGGLLAACRGEATEDAGELEELATQVRGLLRDAASVRSATSR